MTPAEPSGLLAIAETEHAEIELSDSLAWLRQRISKFVVGGIYLLAGQPGIGKSRLSTQIALDLGRRGIKTLYILTEESKKGLANIARQMTSDWPRKDADRALDNVLAEEDVLSNERDRNEV